MPWRTVGQIRAVYFLHLPCAKIYLQGPQQREADLEGQNGTHLVPSQPPTLCNPSVLKSEVLGEGEEKGKHEVLCPLKALAPPRKGGDKMENDSEEGP